VDETLSRVSRSRRVGLLVAALLFTTACGARSVTPSAPADLPAKPADFVEVFTWSQGIPDGAKALSETFSGPHFSYQFGARATRATIDETSGSLEVGPAKAASGHEFVVLYRLQGDDTFAPPPEAPLAVEVLVGTARKRLPKPLQRGTGLIVSVPIGSDATLEVTDDKPYQYSIRNGNGSAPASSTSATPRSSSSAAAPSSQVRWENGDYTGQGAYQGVRTSGPLAITAALGTRAELASQVPGIGTAAAKQVWLRIPEAKITTDDPDLKLDLARSFTLTLSTGTKLNARPNSAGLIFSVPEPFTGATLTINPEFPASSTAKWSTRPQPKEIPLSTG
jgi:hypothetical protein